MTKFNDTPVLPRPVEALPEYAHAAARKTLADIWVKVLEAWHLAQPDADEAPDAKDPA